jgi:fused signal recognition particle receptor
MIRRTLLALLGGVDRASYEKHVRDVARSAGHYMRGWNNTILERQDAEEARDRAEAEAKAAREEAEDLRSNAENANAQLAAVRNACGAKGEFAIEAARRVVRERDEARADAAAWAEKVYAEQQECNAAVARAEAAEAALTNFQESLYASMAREQALRSALDALERAYAAKEEEK